MAGIQHIWPADTIDAIGIKAYYGKFVIQGIDGDEVKLEGNLEGSPFRNLNLEPSERWLQIQTLRHNNYSQFTLQLPKTKVWVVNIFSGRAQIKVEHIQASLNLWLGKGEIQVENYRGTFALVSGNADIRLKDFIEAEMPASPPLPKDYRPTKIENPERWQDFGEGYWPQWGLDFGEKILKRFFGPVSGPTPGISIQIGKGDVNMENIDAKSCIVRASKGDVSLKQGRMGNLDMKIISGDVRCESCLPVDEWTIRANHGDIRLSLTSDAVARLDATTRHGDIRSRTPLVRVTRQGPESWHGNRMVGSIGAKTEGNIPEIRLATLNGDIEIKTQQTPSQYHERSENINSPDTLPVSKHPSEYDTPLAVLTALSEGKISVDEAEQLLRRYKS
jgi:DUF4097 and DUF4098 domain-containing protein YvlB